MSDPGPVAALARQVRAGRSRVRAGGRRVRAGWRRVVGFHDALFVTRWRSALQREARHQQDVLVAALYLSAFGIDDPAAFHTLPVTAELVDDFHRWHQQQGVDRFPEVGVCC